MLQIRGNTDKALDAVADALAGYDTQHPHAKITVYRQNSVSVRVRIVDPEFAEVSKADRHDAVWRHFENLPEEVQSQISLLLLLSPDETGISFANVEFDNPVASRL
ncbi:MAG: hypothetical protein GXY83_33200 [Rhodopirellula sp.]|nr:hypothetical protein [Rhodopirellula sp.]